MLSGVMGGTPCTGVLVRTSVNVSSGASNRMSQFINSIVVLVVIFVVMPAFVFTPMPCVAAILITSACRLVPIAVIKELWVIDKAEFVILFITAGVCVFKDGATGLMVGAIISILRTAIKSQSADTVDEMESSGIHHITVRGQVSYISALKVETQL